VAGSSDNNWSAGGSPDDLPDLPEEWGVIVIPDDLSELDDEVRAIRQELAQDRDPTRWQRFLARPGVRRVRRAAAAALRAPVLIVSMALLVTVASLFASAWPGPARQPATHRTPGSDESGSLTSLPALELFGDDGNPVQLRGRLPAVILLVDGCDCAALVADTIAAVDQRVAVVTVTGKVEQTPDVTAGRHVPPITTTPQSPPQSQGKTVRALHDASGTIRDQLKVGAADGTAAALLVDGTGAVIRVIGRTASAEDLRPDLARL
jgi:hypothetical protein